MYLFERSSRFSQIRVKTDTSWSYRIPLCYKKEKIKLWYRQRCDPQRI